MRRRLTSGRADLRNTKRLIVNADDFGLTEKVNEAIVACHRHGIVTSTTLMANGGAFEHAVALARQTPGLGVGIHLNLTEGRPVSPPAAVATLVGEGGLLARSPGRLVGGLCSGGIRPADVERELRSQIEKVLAAGVPATHVDAHKHVHLWPSVFAVVIRLAREYRIPGVRRAVERPAGVMGLLRRNAGSRSALGKQCVAAWMMRAIACGSRRAVRRAGLKAPDCFFGITQTGFLDTVALREILCRLPDGVSEIMCHPGYVDEALRRTPTRLLAQREREAAALTDRGVRDLVAAMNIELIHYGHLAEAQ